MKCVKCNERQAVGRNINRRLHKYCTYCITVAIAKLPNPDCHYCYGNGDYYWHSDDCHNDDCVLAGGYDDCNGKMISCDCSMLDGLGVFDANSP